MLTSSDRISQTGDKQMQRLSIRFASIALALVACAMTTSVRAALPESVPGQYIVLFKSSEFGPATAGRLDTEVASLGRSLAGRYGARVKTSWSRALTGMTASMSASAAAAMASNPQVALVEQDSVVRAIGSQSPVTWGLDRIDQRNLPLDNTYRYDTDGSIVTAYVIDTGIRTTHSEFAYYRAEWGTNTTGDGVDWDCNGHGTHVAGTVGGATYGVAKGTQLVAVKVLGCNGSGTVSGVISGIDWVIANKALPAVANMSLGGSYSQALNQAVANATGAGIAMVVAAGNSYGSDACGTSPASAPSATTVGATDSSDTRADFSNIGTCLDLFAPGVNITSATNSSDTSIGAKSGTSMAAPHVTGVAALYLNDDPGATPAMVVDTLTRHATSGKITNPGAGSPNLLLFSGTDIEPGFEMIRWATKQGGYWDSQKWVAGDFNGDGRTDFAKAFNCGNGLACIDVHLSTLGGFVMQRWATNQGGYWDAQKWVVGDFNGDGKDDLAKSFNDSGLASIDVHLSSGGTFGIARWATRQGGFWDAQKWVAGDFNGDGKDDLAKSFYDGGLASIDVHLSSGGTFGIARWATRQGGFWDAQKWVAGDFNGDGKDDLAKSVFDGGLASIDVHLSSGGSFGIARWATRQGGFWDAQKWVAGDFNGEGKDDLAKSFYDGGLASIDVHLVR